MKRTIILILLVVYPLTVINSQNRGIVEGRIYNSKNNEPVPFANIVVWGTNTGTVSDMDGIFLFTGLEPGYIELRASAVGFEPYVSPQVLVTNANKVYLDIPMTEMNVALDEVVVKASPFRRAEESPVSLRRIGIAEIEKSPGGNRDISRVIQSFPGVASTPAYRNDVIVRGGGPSENRFYLDGVEIPNLNHFATQGASGGPVGIINVDFIREVDFYSGAFLASKGNALSSVLDFRQVDGNSDRLKFRGAVGASDLALTLDGPLADNTTFIFSARRSYLQFLFSAIGLPFLPTYNDFQFKTRTRFDEKSELTIIGIGALDQFDLNLDANETEDQRYILNYLPVNEQWTYTMGAVYKRYRGNNYDTWVLSRNYLNNTSYKFQDNIEVDSLKILDYSSDEIENKFRYENTARFDNGLKTSFGAGIEYAKYTNSTFQKSFQSAGPVTINYDSFLDMFKWGLFGQVSKSIINGRLDLSVGARMDANNYSDEMSNLLDQFSPRFSASYGLTSDLYLNFNTGRYYQQPPYTALGFRDLAGNLVNRQNGIRYISSDHLVAGIAYAPNENSRLTLEGFYKYYRDYPLSINDSIALASRGADFGTFGDEELVPGANGKSRGIEILYRNRDIFGFNLILSYTLFKSEFENFTGDFIPSSWDNRHLFNITATRGFKGNWDIGFKWRFVGGAPYTPFDEVTSAIPSAWDARGMAYLDYGRFNSLRLNSFHQLDIRIDKQFFLDRWSLMLYLDVQNLYNFKSDEPDRLSRQENDNGQFLAAVGDPPRYPLRVIQSEGQGTILPTVGVIVEF